MLQMRKLSLRDEVCLVLHTQELTVDFPCGSAIKSPPKMQELHEMQVQCLGQKDLLEKELAGSTGNPLQYSCLENPMDRGGWQAAVHGVSKSQTWLRD